MAIKVTLRKKKISKGRLSLYLDFYPPINIGTVNETRREFLKMYIIEKPKTQIEKKQNIETIAIANQICANRLNEHNKHDVYNTFEKDLIKKSEIGEQDFIKYFREIASKRSKSISDSWSAALHYFIDFTNGQVKFKDLKYRLLEDFKYYLLSAKNRVNGVDKLSQNSASSYFNKLKVALREAYREEKIPHNLGATIKSIKVLETRREVLSIEELNKLNKTNCISETFKRMALFSAHTGLRFSDITNLKWSQVEFSKDRGYFINYNQQKTKNVEVHPISKDAYELLGKPKESKKLIFSGLKSKTTQIKHLNRWLKEAGIDKKITFHSFRHTYATLQISGGTDLYTVSKLLGHKNIQTTQIYAKVVDHVKSKTVDIIKLDK